jgi:X-Pro dipeptidyl-peptidase
VRLAVVWAVLLLVPLSGCLGPSPPGPTSTPIVRDAAEVFPLLSPVQYAEQLLEHTPVASFDAKRMDAWVYRPKTPEGARVPVLINFSPYWGNLAPPAGERGDHFSQYLIDYFVPRGYAVVLTSVRGTGDSEGCFNLGGTTEKRDAAAVIDYFATRPWSNGNVAAGGKSYDGTTPQGVATLTPPALKAIVPVSPISELYKYNYKGGISYSQGPTFNARYVEQVGWGNPPDEEFKPDDVACSDLPTIAGEGVLSGATGDYTEYWKERDYAAGADRAQAALFYIHGLQDWNVKPDHILPWLERYAGPKKVWLHQWTDPANGGHSYPWREDWNYTMLRFFDQTLKGIDTGFFDEPTVQVEDSQHAWRYEDAWPPLRARPVRFQLSSGGGATGLLGEVPGSGGARSFDDDGQLPGNAPDANALFYDSGPLSSDLRIAGEPRLSLRASSDRAVGKVAATLYDVDSSGEAHVIDWGGLNLRHRDDVRTPQAIEPDAVYDLVFPLFPQDTVVPAGHRLRLVLAGNAGFADDGFAQFLSEPTQSKIAVVEDAQAYLELPVEAAAGLRFESPPPAETRCWAC